MNPEPGPCAYPDAPRVRLLALSSSSSGSSSAFPSLLRFAALFPRLFSSENPALMMEKDESRRSFLASLRREGAIRGGIEVRWVAGRRETVTEKGVPRACKGYKCQIANVHPRTSPLCRDWPEETSDWHVNVAPRIRTLVYGGRHFAPARCGHRGPRCAVAPCSTSRHSAFRHETRQAEIMPVNRNAPPAPN